MNSEINFIKSNLKQIYSLLEGECLTNDLKQIVQVFAIEQIQINDIWSHNTCLHDVEISFGFSLCLFSDFILMSLKLSFYHRDSTFYINLLSYRA